MATKIMKPLNSLALNNARCWGVWCNEQSFLCFVSRDRVECRYYIGVMSHDDSLSHLTYQIVRFDLADCYRVK